jgi:hypothetical protein
LAAVAVAVFQVAALVGFVALSTIRAVRRARLKPHLF